jgi:hypothetical protein
MIIEMAWQLLRCFGNFGINILESPNPTNGKI